jgi:hypothetical protein
MRLIALRQKREMDDEVRSRHVEALRDQLLGDLDSLEVFAAAIECHPKTLKKKNPPTVYINRKPYIPKEQGKAWLLNGCKSVENGTRRGRGRAT